MTQEMGFKATLPGSLDDARDRVTGALAAEGFGVLTRIDVAATLQAKLGKAMEPYEILGACNPTLAHAALEVDRNVGLLLPCNVVLRGVDGAVEVSIVDPVAMFSALPESAKARLEGAAADARGRLGRVAAALRG